MKACLQCGLQHDKRLTCEQKKARVEQEAVKKSRGVKTTRNQVNDRGPEIPQLQNEGQVNPPADEQIIEEVFEHNDEIEDEMEEAANIDPLLLADDENEVVEVGEEPWIWTECDITPPPCIELRGSRVTPPTKPPYIGLPLGARNIPAECVREIDFFELLFTIEMMNTYVTESNGYATFDPRLHIKVIDITEFKVF